MASFDCEASPTQQSNDQSGLSWREKFALCSAFAVATMAGYFVLGPLTYSDSHELGKFVASKPGSWSRPRQHSDRGAPMAMFWKAQSTWSSDTSAATNPSPDNTGRVKGKPAWAMTGFPRSVQMPEAPADPNAPKENFLEFEPYYDKKKMPDNLFKPKNPFEATIVSVERMVGPKATGETMNIVINHGGDMPYIEGQSYGVVAPGLSPKTGKPNKVRLYSIGSSRYGDDQTGKTTTLCVRRATYWCPELKADDPAKQGVCSNYLCDAKPGDMVKLTGPSGKVMLLPEEKPETDIIMVATGTGIAPMRSFLKRMFVDDTPYSKDFKGIAWLFLGVANSDALLYDDEWKAIQAEHPDQFRYDIALSREQTNQKGGKMYIQDKVEEYSDEIFTRLENGAHIYFCGLKGMMPGIQEMLERVAVEKKIDFTEFLKKLKSNGQWHVEVY
jgi:ferredoxin--NADP+ reductase